MPGAERCGVGRASLAFFWNLRLKLLSDVDHTTEALVAALYWVAWPGMLLTSAYALYRTVRFYRQVEHAAFARLVLLMVVAWVSIMVGLGWIVTMFVQRNAAVATPLAAPVVILWGVSMATIVWVVQRWGHEAVSINLYYLELKSLDGVKTQLINTVAHELNTPLTPVKLKLELLSSGALGPLTERQGSAVKSIQRSMGRVHAIVDQVVLCMQIQSNTLRLSPRAQDLVPTVGKAVGATVKDAEARGQEIRLHTRSGVHAQHDAKRIHRVVVSLLHNALKFSPEGAAIDVTVRTAGGFAEIEVQDGGVGFSPEEGARLFQPFRQAEDVHMRSDAGAGLDLYIARGIVDAHQGSIEARSRGQGQGATFLVRLPVAPFQLPAPDEA